MQGSLASFEKRYVPKVLITEEANALPNGDPINGYVGQCYLLGLGVLYGIQLYSDACMMRG